jgi:hypothetical protein
MTEETNLVSYCGLYCGDCYNRQGKIADLSRDLRKELRQANFERAAEALGNISFFAPFKNYAQCYEVLGTMVKLRCHRTCREGGGPPSCKVRNCCRKKESAGCLQCEEFESCHKLDFLKQVHADANPKNLRTLKKSGVEGFVQGKRYW